jgi:hypothetical protein
LPKPKQQNSFFREARARCEWLRTRPERFPDLYDQKKLQRRAPTRSVAEGYVRIMDAFLSAMDLESQRVGTPLHDGSIRGMSEATIAIRTGLGDPRQRRPDHWLGRKRIQMRIRELREAGLIFWGRPEYWAKHRACNRREKIAKGPKAGLWRLYASVRRVARKFFEAIGLSTRLDAEIADLKRRRAAGDVPPTVDVLRRRERDREIKRRQRERQRARLLAEPGVLAYRVGGRLAPNQARRPKRE